MYATKDGSAGGMELRFKAAPPVATLRDGLLALVPWRRCPWATSFIYFSTMTLERLLLPGVAIMVGALPIPPLANAS